MKLLFYSFLFILLTTELLAQQWQTPGVVVAGGNGYGLALNQLQDPGDAKIDTSGNIYVLAGGNRVTKWAPNATTGELIIGANGSGNGADQLWIPSGLWLEDDGTLYIVDAGNSRVQMWNPGATTGVTVAGGNGNGSNLNQLSWPGSLFKKGNDLYIVDAGNSRVLKWTIGQLQGEVVAGNNGFGSNLNQLGIPMINGFVYVDANDNLYIPEYSNDRVTKWTPGATEGIVVADISATGVSNVAVSGITFIGNKMLLSYSQVTNSPPNYIPQNRVTIWEDGLFLGDAISTASDELKQPRSVFLDQNNNLYVVEGSGGGSNRIKRFNYMEPCATPTPISEENQTLIEGATIDDIEITGQGIIWYADEELTQPLVTTEELTDGTTYYATQTIGNCESESIAVTITLYTCQTPAPTGSNHQYLSSGSVLNDIQVNGTMIKWYADQALNQPLSDQTIIEDMNTYYATQTIGECESEASLAVMVHLTYLSISNIEKEDEITYFPNPFYDVVSVKSIYPVQFIQIMDLTGKEIYRNNSMNDLELNLNLDYLKSGNYLLNVVTESNRSTFNLIKL